MKENIRISVIGAGQMGTRIGEVASRDHRVVFFDTEPEKAQRAANRFGGRSAGDIRHALDSQILFLAVPGSAVIKLLEDHYSAVSMDTLWVNISTFVALKDMREVTGESGNIISCKIIGQSDMVSDDNPCAFIIDSSHSENSMIPVVEDIFKKGGGRYFRSRRKIHGGELYRRFRSHEGCNLCSEYIATHGSSKGRYQSGGYSGVYRHCSTLPLCESGLLPRSGLRQESRTQRIQ